MSTYDLSKPTSAELEVFRLALGAGQSAFGKRASKSSAARWWFGLWALLLTIAGLAVTPAPSLAQNLVVNGGFTTNNGDFSYLGAPPWTQPTGTGAGYFVCTNAGGCTTFIQFFAPGTAQNGIAYLWLTAGGAPTPPTAGATETITLAKSGTYQFSFYYEDYSGGGDGLKATVGGTTVFNNPNVTATTWTPSSSKLTLGAGSTAITFLGTYGTCSCLLLDTVSLTFLNPNSLSLPQGLPANQTNVGNAINNFMNGGGTLPTNFQNLFNYSPSQLQAALTELDGEAATDAEKGAFALMNQFLGLMLDPFVTGRLGTGGGPIGFAPDQQANFPPDIALAYASVLKAPPPSFAQRWTAWGSAFGASSTTNGNAAIGSNNVTATDYGFAAGMDYHLTPDTLYGFALAGGGTNWNLAQGLGTGRSDALQAGVYGKSYWGPSYVAAALGFTNNWFSTNRTALGDDLTANFAGQSYGGRLETGYRFGAPMGGTVVGVTPYAAIQTQWFHTPTYSETDLAGGGLGLTYNAMTANDTRSELGARFDDPTLLNEMPLILRVRLAWAHDWVSNPALDAAFQSLPGSSFVVNGATPPKDSALASAGAQYFLTHAWSFTAKFDGEFASSSQTYGGTGTLRYTW